MVLAITVENPYGESFFVSFQKGSEIAAGVFAAIQDDDSGEYTSEMSHTSDRNTTIRASPTEAGVRKDSPHGLP